MTIKEFIRNVSLIELGFEVDEQSQALYNYLNGKLTGLGKYVLNNPVHRKENQYFYGYGNRNMVIQTDEGYDKYLLCTRDVFDSIMDIASPYVWNDDLLNSILEYWLGKEYDIKFDRVYEMFEHSKTVKFKLAEEL